MPSSFDRTQAAEFLDGSIGHLLHRASQSASELFTRRAGPGGLTPRQYAVLAAVAASEGTNQTELVRATGIDRSTLGQIVQRMVERGLLNRRQMPHDQRAYAVSLGARGSETLAAYRPMMAEIDAQLRQAVPARMQPLFVAALREIARLSGRADAAGEGDGPISRHNGHAAATRRPGTRL